MVNHYVIMEMENHVRLKMLIYSVKKLRLKYFQGHPTSTYNQNSLNAVSYIPT